MSAFVAQFYPLNFDHTGINFIGESEWTVIVDRWAKLAVNNPSSAEFIAYVSQWVIDTLAQVGEIAIEGNL